MERFARKPYPDLLPAPGPGGTGKTASAFALAHELGCEDTDGAATEWTGCYTEPSSGLTISRATQLFTESLWRRPLCGSGWKVVVIEEFERVVSDQVPKFLKTALDKAAGNLPPRTVVVATSNNPTGLEKWLFQRFEDLRYSGGPEFCGLAQERLAEIWLAERPGEDMPFGWRNWGWEGEGSRCGWRCGSWPGKSRRQNWRRFYREKTPNAGRQRKHQ